MINLLAVIYGFLTPLIFGAALLLIFKRVRFSILEFLVLSFGLGGIILTTLIFVFSWLEFNLSIIKNIILSLSALTILWIIYTVRRKRINLAPQFNFNQIKREKKWVKIIIVLLILAISLKIIFVFADSYLRPILQYDAVITWTLKAKIFFLQNQLILDPRQPYFLGTEWRLPNYPLHLPLWQLWQALTVNNWQESWIKFLFPLHYLGLILIFYLNLRRHLSLVKKLIFTFFLATLPFLVYHARHEYLDLPLAFYLLAAMIYCWRGIKEGDFSFLIIGSLFAAGAAWTKNEGFFLGLIILLSVGVHFVFNRQLKIKFKHFLFSIFYFLFSISPWLIFKFIHHLGFENESRKLIFKPEALKILFFRLTETTNWNVWWLIFILLIIFSWRKIFSRDYLPLSLAVFGSILFYLGIYIFTSNAEYLAGAVTDQRNLLVIIPLTVFYIALLFSKNSDKIET